MRERETTHLLCSPCSSLPSHPSLLSIMSPHLHSHFLTLFRPSSVIPCRRTYFSSCISFSLSPLILPSFKSTAYLQFYFYFFLCQTHCVVCGYTKGKDGKVINEGSDTFLTPVPASASSLPFTRQITPKAVNNDFQLMDDDSKSKTLLSKRKDTAHDDYEEEDIDELENDNDNDDDEDADDSVAFSKYVHARMKESGKPSKVANFGSEQQYKVSSAGTKKIPLSGGNDTRSQLAKIEKVLSTLLSVRLLCYYLFCCFHFLTLYVSLIQSSYP